MVGRAPLVQTEVWKQLRADVFHAHRRTGQQCGSSCLPDVRGEATLEAKRSPTRQYSVESIWSPEAWSHNARVLCLLQLLHTVRYVIQTPNIVIKSLRQSISDLFV
jgi:hypothetical protein